MSLFSLSCYAREIQKVIEILLAIEYNNCQLAIIIYILCMVKMHYNIKKTVGLYMITF